MALTIIAEPQLLNALYQPIVYEYQHLRSYPSDRATIAGQTTTTVANFPGPYENQFQVWLRSGSGVDPNGEKKVSIGSYYYIVSKPSNILASPDALLLVDIVPIENDRPYLVFDFPLYSAPPQVLLEGVDIFSLEAWLQLEPGFNLYVNEQPVGTAEGIRVGNTITVQINTQLEVQFSPLVPPTLGDNPEWYRSFRLDTVELGDTTPGNTFHVIKATQQPAIPSCANVEPAWVFDLDTLRCKYNAPRSSSEREAKQKDTNPNSLTYNQYRNSGAYFLYDSNATACPVTYSSAAYSQAFQKNNCPSNQAGSFVTFTVPAGQFTSTVSQADADNQAIAYAAANGQAYANANGTCGLPLASIRIANYQRTYNGAYSFVDTADIYLDMTVAGQPFPFSGLVNIDKYFNGNFTDADVTLTNQSSYLLESGFQIEVYEEDGNGNVTYYQNNYYSVATGSGYTII